MNPALYEEVCAIIVRLEAVKAEISKASKFRPKSALGIIREQACAIFEVTPTQLQSHIRTDRVAYARMSALLVGVDLVNDSNSGVCAFFGYRSHASLGHAQKAVADRFETDPKFREKFNLLKSRCISLLNPQSEAIKAIA